MSQISWFIASAALVAHSTIFAASYGTHALESVPANEAAATAEVTSIIASVLKRDTAANDTMRRDAHAKHHGCVEATFTVNETLRPELTTSVFQAGASYPAFIRFSNGSGKSQDDHEGDGRGIAIKLSQVPGEKTLEEQSSADQQDFLLINHQAFFVRNAADYIEFSRAIAKGSPVGFFFPGINPFNWRTHEMKIAKAIQGKKMVNPLAGTYFSMTPYALGESKAMKYRVSPCNIFVAVNQFESSKNFLRENMQASLKTRDACFELAVQVRSNPRTQPIEDPTIIWTNHRARFKK